MTAIDYPALRAKIARGAASIDCTRLRVENLPDIAWSGSRTHLENVAAQLKRVGAGEVEYLVVRADQHPVCKGGIDFAKEVGAGTLWQIATHPSLEGLGLATRLIAELEAAGLERGVRRFRLGVEVDNTRARRLYEHVGYHAIGNSTASWEAEAADGSRFLYEATLTEMEKLADLG